MSDRITKPHHGHRFAGVAAGLLLLSGAALAQVPTVDPPAAKVPPASQVPLREGNIYDHRDHQPTQAEDSAAGIATANHRAVQAEVDRLLYQTDRLDRTSEQELHQ